MSLPVKSLRDMQSTLNLNFFAAFATQNYDQIEQRAQALYLRSRSGDRQDERNFYNAFNYELNAYLLTNRARVCSDLQAWRNAQPQSVMAKLATAFFWGHLSQYFRTETTVDAVSDAQWDAAYFCHEQFFICALDVLQHDATMWPIGTHMLQRSKVLGYPKWLEELLSGYVARGINKLSDEGKKLLNEFHVSTSMFIDVPVELPPALAQFVASHPYTNKTSENFLLEFALTQFEKQYLAQNCFAHFLRPRWGGRKNDIQHFSDSYYCQYFDELYKNRIRLIAWLDQVSLFEANIDDEDPDSIPIANLIQRTKAILKHPLDAASQAQVRTHLGYLYYRLNNFKAAEEEYQFVARKWRLSNDQLAQPFEIWWQGDHQQTWIVDLVQDSILYESEAAAIYGFLCLYGYAGLEKNEAVAREWMQYSYALKPTTNYAQVCSFHVVTEFLFNQNFLEECFEYWKIAADIGSCRCQFTTSRVYESVFNDLEASLKYNLLGYAQAHIVCGQNAAAYYWNNSLKQEDWELKLSLQKRALTMFIGCYQLTEKFPQSYTDVINAICHVFPRIEGDDELVEKVYLVVEPQAVAGYYPAMVAMAKLRAGYGFVAQHWEHYRDAIRWVESCLRVAPKDENVLELKAQLEGKSFFSQIKYDVVRRGIKPDEMPQAADDFN